MGTTVDHDDVTKLALECVAGIVRSADFQNMSAEFVEHHCAVFSFEDENKLEYTALHKEYQDLVEGKLRSDLIERDVDFETLVENLADFISKGPNLTSEVAEALDLLTSLGDFQDFKDMMLVAKREREEQGALPTDLVQRSDADADFGVQECERMFKQLASASGEGGGWKVDVDKRWYRSETKTTAEGEQYSRSGVVVDLTVAGAVEMMTGYANPRMSDWMGHLKNFSIVREFAPGDKLVRAELDFHGIMAMAMSSSMPKVVHTRVIVKEDFPQQGETTIGKIPWDMEGNCHFQSPYFKVRTMSVKPHEGCTEKTLITTVEAASMAWMPSWIKNWMSATIAPKMMSGIVSKYKKVKSEQEGKTSRLEPET